MGRSRIAVIGAGIIGCLVARELAARLPGTQVTVLDRDGVGSGASRRSAGLHLLRGGTDRTRRMSAYSHNYYAHLKRAHPGLPIYPVGATVVTGPGEPGDRLIERYLPQAEPESLTPEPPLSAGHRTWRISGSHYCDVYRLTQALALRMRATVEFAEGVAVTDLVPGDHGVTIRCGTGERIEADAVILAPGPWLAAPAWRDLIAPLGLRVKRVVALHIALHIARPPDPADQAILFDADDSFLLPLAHRGHWLFSYACREWDVDPDRPATGLTAADIDAARDCLRRNAPTPASASASALAAASASASALADACRGGQVFCDAYSPSREPVIEALDPAGRIVFAGAANGSGYRLAPAIAAQAVSQLAQHLHEGVTGDPQYV